MDRLSLFGFLTRFHNEHFLFLWKSWYFLALRSFGVEPIGWHAWIIGFQCLGALALHKLALQLSASRMSAAIAGLLWAGASFGSFDNPLTWIGASHLAMATSLVVVAALGASRGTHQPVSLTVLWTALALTCSFLMMSSIVVFSVLVPLVVVLRWSSYSGTQRWATLTAWALPAAGIVAIQLWGISHQGFEATAPSEQKDLGNALPGFLAAYGSAAARLIAGISFKNSEPAVALSLLLITVFVVGWFRSQRWLLPICVATALHTALVAFARSEFPPSQFQAMGRFTYIPTLAVACVFVSSAEMLLATLKLQGSRYLVPGAVALGLMFVGGQLRQSYSTVQLCAVVNADSYRPWSQSRELLNEIDAGDRQRHQPTRIPDFPISCRSFVQSLSGFQAYLNNGHIADSSEPRSRLQVVAIAEMTKDDWAYLEKQLTGSENPQARLWLEAIQEMITLEQFVVAVNKEAVPVFLPEIAFPFPTTRRATLSALLTMLGSDTSLIEVKPNASITDQQRSSSVRRLGKVAHPFASQFAKLLNVPPAP
ncbi:hypothetical protein [Neorhodopirellula pilleata]|uniref:hypothetical protein n=1 Tax=Neorhodopirellula pilleata TaxID=2714738 RepID=UPI0011B462FF|nr:hypothetical protein [Neorhodopirellula pilleata]